MSVHDNNLPNTELLGPSELKVKTGITTFLSQINLRRPKPMAQDPYFAMRVSEIRV